MNEELISIDWNAHDKRMAATHEAGHALAAILCGGQEIDAWLIKNESPTNKEEKSWVGKCSCRPRVADRELYCIAGYVAEQISENWEATSWDLIDEVEFDAYAMSASDREGIPEDSAALEKLLERAIAMLKGNWPQHQKIVAALMDDEEDNVFVFRQRE